MIKQTRESAASRSSGFKDWGRDFIGHVTVTSLWSHGEPICRGKLGTGGVDGVYALNVPGPEGAPTVVHFHGNGEQLADGSTWLAQRFQEAGLGFYAVEYPGYGLAAVGQGPSEKGIYAAAESALAHLHGPLVVPRERTVLQGQPLGAGVAVEMAKRGLGTRSVPITPYTSIVEVGARIFPWLPATQDQRLACASSIEI